MSGARNRPNCLALILIGLFFLPVLAVLGQAFGRPNAWPELLGFLRSGQFRRVLAFSTSQAFWSAFFSLALAVPGAYFFGRYRFPGKRLLRSVMILPFMLPGILVVLAMVVFYGQNGILNTWLAALFPGRDLVFTGLYGYKGIILAHVFYNFAFCLRMLGERWERISPKLEEASAVLGAGRFATWWRVILPLLAPTIGYLGVLVFLYSFLSFTVVLVLGGYLYQTFEVLIYIEYNNKLRFAQASMLAVVQIFLLTGIIALQRWTQRLVQRQSGEVNLLPPLRPRKQPVATGIFLCYLAGSLLFFFMPLFFVLYRSFKKRGLPDGAWTLDNYRQLFGAGFRFAVGRDLWTVVGTSLALAITVGLVTMVLAYVLARQRRQNHGDGLTCGYNCQWGFPSDVCFWPVKLVGHALPPALLIIWAQVFLAFPLVYALLRTRGGNGGGDDRSGPMFGASGWELFRTVELPLMRKALSSAFAYGAALSLGDLSAVLVLGQGK